MAEDKDVILIGADAAQADPDVVTIEEEAAENPLPKHAVRNGDGSVTLPLRMPVTVKTQTVGSNTVNEDTISELVMHRLRGGDMIAVQQAPAERRIIVSIARSARMNSGRLGVIYERMDGADAMACAQVVAHFLGSGPTTGQ